MGFRSKRRERKTSMKLVVEVLYLDLEDLKQSKSDRSRKREERERERATPFIKSLLGASVPPRTESDFWPTLPSRELNSLPLGQSQS